MPSYSHPNGTTIDTDIAGGNIRILDMDARGFLLAPDLRDTEGEWFYWAFRVSGVRDQRVRFDFGDRNVVGCRGPAVSTDGGLEYGYMRPECADASGFTWDFDGRHTETIFCVAVPYGPAELRSLTDRVGRSGLGHLGSLCTTRKGRTVALITVGRSDAPVRVLLTSRHHACESPAGYALEGLVDAALARDALGRWYRDHVQIIAVPFMDTDGVVDGDQGKNRRPHDHNRDYIDDPVYPSVRALMDLVSEWRTNALTLAIDMHCPLLKGGMRNEHVHFVGGSNATVWDRVQTLTRHLERVRRGPIPYSRSHSLPFGEDWNVASAGVQNSCAGWLGELAATHLSATVEIPYSCAGGVEVNPMTARSFGRDLARAVRSYCGSRNGDPDR